MNFVLGKFAKRDKNFLREEIYKDKIFKYITYLKNFYIMNQKYNLIISIFWFNSITYFDLILSQFILLINIKANIHYSYNVSVLRNFKYLYYSLNKRKYRL